MSDEENKEQRLAFWLPGAAVALTTAAVLFFSVWGWQTGRIDGSKNATASEASAASSNNSANTVTAAAAGTAVATQHVAANPASSPATATASSASATDENDVAKVVVENGIVKFYFATGKADLAQGANDALKDVIAGIKSGKKAVISGYHDETGNKAQNAELSKQRAFAVRDALLAAGVPQAQIELREPKNTEGSGSKAEARRVEVILE